MRIKSQRQRFKKFQKKFIFFSQNQLSTLSVCFLLILAPSQKIDLDHGFEAWKSYVYLSEKRHRPCSIIDEFKHF
ncbi:hypothetical protein THF1A12_530020 [Vibrio jasicida]|uniref:Uncharacterized protein n=1 Tax=Vibrio jasicida TaxID=766224 RepID=A0AAU9QY69_9VIBR|nr:hypothetical protein THF1A12_530020 [Vibrio jasicida]